MVDEIVKEVPIELKLKDELEIDEADLLAELSRQPALYFYWGVMWAKASRARRRQRLKTRETEARLSAEFRKKTAEESPGTRVTEALLNSFLHSNNEYIIEEQNLIQTEYMEETLEVAKEGFKQRGQALQELTRHSREEAIYGDEMKAMNKAYEARVERKAKKKSKEETL